LLDRQRIIVIGASAGGVEALLRLGRALPSDLAAPVLVVLHIGGHSSLLPELLNADGRGMASFARTGLRPQPGRIYVAPPDHHLLIEGGLMRLYHGPKEHHARPAIDPLFRSAALDLGARVIGVVLTGMLDDGSAGLAAISACRGVCVVQDPAEAPEPSMPIAALRATQVDHVVRLDELAPLLAVLAAPLEAAVPFEPPAWLRKEHAVSLGRPSMNEVGHPSGYTCPDCGGALFRLAQGTPRRFLCHTGHAFSLLSLANLQGRATEEALWAGLRALQEKDAALRELAQMQETAEGAQTLIQADQVLAQIGVLRSLLDADAVGMSPPGTR